ncbi:hypothetical protein SPRG_14537 [Saprolegnia parasitica CBS 223.65]|uniref:Uncharacterized protein n=1 Tax=Saprolegnia parasitica (strain CBS 223.65) TaxID=695850 RepID=A0A067BZA5_SAPPC|nr:hypothetical protein SPRG_14537 [Saprolegnia parasitica CBS 223.65]KDO19636.1 hypothetical protein SPRG_14537 [Saprolegnia parasitica CBS 223.65]|eukprot:XP_012209637.1 hypothetical protein SPRG_14537 [Saprolegnia parasitica CBS 223.65]
MADEVAAPSPPSTPLPMGTFTIALGQLVLPPALDAPPAESDAPPLSFWCEVSVRMGKDLNTTWWYPSSDEHKRKVATDVLQLSPASDDSEPPSFGFVQASPPFVLSDDSLIPQLAKASVHLELYSGYTRERETDVLLGAASWAFLPSLFLGGPSTTRLAFPTALVECTLAFDMGFVSHFQHMKVLAVESVQVHRLPTEWRPILKDGDDAQKLCDENTTKCSLALKLPVALSSAMPETTFTLDGRLSYDATATDPDAAWLVRFPLESPLILPLDKEGTDALVDAIESGRLVTMSLTRTLGTDVWQATAQLAMDGFLTPGTLNITLREPLRKGTAPARETLEEALTKAANNEEKKKAQAALNDYENLLTRIAGHAAIYVSAGSAASLEATVYPQALVPLPPVPLPPTKSMAEYIPPRPPLPAYQSHEATATMRKEVRKILAILMKEYDGLFALPDDVR